MKSVVFILVVLFFVVTPVSGQSLSDATGLINRLDIQTSGYAFEIKLTSNFDLTDYTFEKDEKQIFNLASGGFDSTVRLAKSSAEMWSPIFNQNKDNILTVLDTYIDKLKTFRENIESENNEEIFKLIQEANKIKRVLK